MKQLIRGLSRVYIRRRRSKSNLLMKDRGRLSGRAVVPEGHLPIYVGEEKKRFVVSAELLNHPIFIELLNQSADEYGYEQQGVLRIRCRVSVFEEVLETLIRSIQIGGRGVVY